MRDSGLAALEMAEVAALLRPAAAPWGAGTRRAAPRAPVRQRLARPRRPPPSRLHHACRRRPRRVDPHIPRRPHPRPRARAGRHDVPEASAESLGSAVPGRRPAKLGRVPDPRGLPRGARRGLVRARWPAHRLPRGPVRGQRRLHRRSCAAASAGSSRWSAAPSTRCTRWRPPRSWSSAQSRAWWSVPTAGPTLCQGWGTTNCSVQGRPRWPSPGPRWTRGSPPDVPVAAGRTPCAGRPRAGHRPGPRPGPAGPGPRDRDRVAPG
jgi:hypothetical protein